MRGKKLTKRLGLVEVSWRTLEEKEEGGEKVTGQTNGTALRSGSDEKGWGFEMKAFYAGVFQKKHVPREMSFFVEGNSRGR
jgi:hypothetical protein